MTAEERDPLVDKLQALPKQSLRSERASTNLRAAEAALVEKVRPGIRWPELALAVVLSTTGLIYAVDSVHKLNNIYVSNQTSNMSR